MEFWIIGGDRRNYWAACSLEALGHDVHTFGVPERMDEPMPFYMEHLILPFPSFQGALIRGRSAVPIEELLHRIDGDSTVYGGLLKQWHDAFTHRGATLRDLYGTEPLTTANAVSTAEGAIQTAMEASDITLHGAACLVLGFGRIGKVLAQKLHGLSANVTIAARKPGDRALAEALGLHSEEIGLYPKGLEQYDYIFNTVPAPVLTEAQLAELTPQCVLTELASAPGGFSRDFCMQRGLSCCYCPGLPGKCAPRTAGSLYAQSILTLLQTEAQL